MSTSTAMRPFDADRDAHVVIRATSASFGYAHLTATFHLPAPLLRDCLMLQLRSQADSDFQRGLSPVPRGLYGVRMSVETPSPELDGMLRAAALQRKLARRLGRERVGVCQTSEAWVSILTAAIEAWGVRHGFVAFQCNDSRPIEQIASYGGLHTEQGRTVLAEVARQMLRTQVLARVGEPDEAAPQALAA